MPKTRDRRTLTRAALLAGALGLCASWAAPALAQTAGTAQSGTARAFGGQIMLTDQNVLPPSAEAEVEAPPFGDDADEALVEVPADPLAVSFTARGSASVHRQADLTSVLGEDAEPQSLEGPYHAQGVGAVENLEVLVDAVGEDVPLIRADLVRGEAVGVCVGDQAQYSASSEVVNLVIGGETLPINAPLSQIVDAITDVLEQTTLNQVADVQRNVVTQLPGGGIAVDALVVTVLAAAGDDPLVTIRLGHGEVAALTCGPGGDNPLGVTKTGPGTVAPGAEFTYTITASNDDGERTCTDVVVVDTVTGPDGTEITSTDPGPPEGTIDGLTVTFDVGTLEPGETRTLTLTVRAPSSAGATLVDDVTMTANCGGEDFEATDRLEAPEVVAELPGSPSAPSGPSVARADLPRTGAAVPLALAGVVTLAGLGLAGLRRLTGGA